MEPRRELAGVPTVLSLHASPPLGSDGGMGAARGPLPGLLLQTEGARLQGAGDGDRPLGALGSLPPTTSSGLSAQLSSFAGSCPLGIRVRVRLPGRECYCSSERRLIDKEST